MKKKLLILCQRQWGYHVDTYKYSIFLKNDFDITYLCWDYKEKKVKNEGVRVKYISRNGSLLLRNIRYLYSSLNYIKKTSPKICFIKYFQGCFILKLVNWKKVFIFDIRTSSVNKNTIKRAAYNYVMFFESKFFSNITIISESLAKKIKLEKKSNILPLGSDIISKKNKTFDKLNLIYIGTLEGRDIIKTIEGFSIYLKKYKPKENLFYTIVGNGNNINELRQYVKNNKLEKNINIIGSVPFNNLEAIMDSHNIGISFVPCTNYFDCQPVTKTFDYLLSGMPVIATNTSENRKVINSQNGILITDDSECFADGINKIKKNISMYNSEKIRVDAKKYDRKYIISNFKNYLNNLL